jgi:hypothetical protein
MSEKPECSKMSKAPETLKVYYLIEVAEVAKVTLLTNV